ncbi:MAG: MFS transporter [Firmicutes bacterium]|nr:MFS transporter [Bacillota bacterium]
MTDTAKKNGLRKKLAYALGFLGDAFYYQFISSYLLVFLTGPAGLSSKDAGTIGSVIVLADAFFSLFVGRITDGLKCKYGRRRPIILMSAFVLPLIFCLTFLTVGGSNWQKIVYYTAMGLLFYTFFITYYVSHIALGADISDGYDDSIKLNSVVSFVTNLSTLICLAMPLPILKFLQERGMTPSASWLTLVLGMSALVVFGLLFCWNETRGREKLGVVDQKSQSWTEMLRDYKELLRIKPYRRLIETKFILNFCYTMYSNAMVFFIQYCVKGDSEWVTSLAFTTNSILGFVVIPVVTAIAMKYGKRRMTVITSAFYGVAAIALYFTGVHSIPLLLLYVLVHSIGVHGFWQLYTTNLYDVADLDEYRTGRRREGNIVGLQSFLCGFSVSLSVRVMTLLLEQTGFDGSAAVQNAASLQMLGICFVLLPGITSIAGAVSMYLYRVEREGHLLVREALDRRAAGEAPLSEADTTKIEAMFL